MLIRPKYHWLLLMSFIMYTGFALYIQIYKQDHSMVSLYICFAGVSIVFWATTFTTLRGGILMKRILLIPFRILPTADIIKIELNKTHLKKNYGTVVVVTTMSGVNLTLQPNHPAEFLALLRNEAPQAEFLV